MHGFFSRTGSKWEEKWEGPFVIEKVSTKGSYKLQGIAKMEPVSSSAESSESGSESSDSRAILQLPSDLDDLTRLTIEEWLESPDSAADDEEYYMYLRNFK